MFGYIYKTTNIINGKIYIGQKKGEFNPCYRGSGILIKKAIEKYGKTNFKSEQIASAETREELNILEIFYINKYRNNGNLYNISKGGTGGVVYDTHPMLGRKHKKETKDRWKIDRSGDKNTMYGIRLTGSLNGMYGKKHSQETKDKIAKELSKYKGNNHWNTGIVRSEEFKKKQSDLKKEFHRRKKEVCHQNR